MQPLDVPQRFAVHDPTVAPLWNSPTISEWGKSLLATLVLLCACLHGPANATQPLPERPNILLIFTDDHGYGDVSTYQKSDVLTPHIDSIAAEGILFTAMRANCTVCSPSRAALLTGRYADRVGVPGVIR